MSLTGATLSGSYTGASAVPTAAGFKYGTSSTNLNQTATATVSGTSGSLSASLSGLSAGTTYYYQAFVTVSGTGDYSSQSQTFYGEVHSFATPPAGYLDCYEMPALSLASGNTSPTSIGVETFGATNWYEYDTTTSTRKVVTHTYSYGNKVYRNYTVMVDQNKRCPLWAVYAMHSAAYPNNNVERGDFNVNTSYDPAIPSSWQSSGSTSDYNNGDGYGRGHLCASEDRQTCRDGNNQTFYYTNQAPQWQNGFNGGMWATLEGRVQTMAPSGRDTLYVATGTLFETSNSGSSNDGGTVARPSHFYKCLMMCSFNADGTMSGAQGIAFIYSNEAHSGQYYAPEFVTSIAAIEQRAGFNFFANVPTSFQSSAESNTNHKWFTGVTPSNNLSSVSDKNWGTL